jgi:2-iminoacetate synthase
MEMQMTTDSIPIIDPERIESILNQTGTPEKGRIRDILARALEMRGLSPGDAAVLGEISAPELLRELFDTAKKVKETIYGKRLVIFAPLYVSNLCGNECLYCAFRASNPEIVRRALTHEEIVRETEILVDQGHKRVLLVAGESYPKEGFDYILKSIAAVYGVKTAGGGIRRINVNVAPLKSQEFQQLKQTGIGTYQLFQETYHPGIYSRVHVGGRKRDYAWRITAIDRAMEAGIDDIGIGVLFGLSPWRWELQALLQHISHLENRFGVGPHTISVPRLEPATGSDIAAHPPHAVGDTDFRKIVAILRLSVPYTGIIMSTRETPNMRRETFALGVSQISAGSRTNPGGYAEGEHGEDGSQFSLGDHRPLDDVIRDVAEMGYVPSFCTGCYRLGRTGRDFMDLARPGDIRMHCDPNAASTFMEYLLDFAGSETRKAGLLCIREFLNGMTPEARERTEAMLRKVEAGSRDVYC